MSRDHENSKRVVLSIDTTFAKSLNKSLHGDSLESPTVVYRDSRTKTAGGTTRGQSTIELMTIVAVALVILAVLVNFTAEQVNYLEKQRAAKTAELSVQMLISAADELYTQGPGATRYLQLTWPEGVQVAGTRIEDHSIVVNVYGSYVTGTSVPQLVGALPTISGLQNIRIRAFDGFVMIGVLDISASPSTIFTSVARDENSSTAITLSNNLTDDIPQNLATISISSSWSHSDVNLVFNSSPGTLSAASTLLFDTNVFAGASAVGTYSGKITVTSTFPSKVETLIIPIQVNVNVGSAPNLVTFPSSISLSTFGIDTNSTAFQFCNVSDTEIKNVSITPSAGAPGTWLDSFPTIDSMGAQSCQSVDVNVSVPTDSISSYAGSLSISDYTGANTITTPFTINVLGMSSVFSWDWTPAIRSVQTIQDFSVANHGRKPITVSQVTMRDWTLCDQQLSWWNSLVINSASRFIGSLEDGNTADVTDFNIPVLTEYSNNSLSFSDNIKDNDEPFVAVVDFSDGTQYTSSTFGTICALDTNAPASVSDLRLVPGPEPESMVLSFTFPGDDGNVGRITDINMRISQTIIDSQSAFDSATVLGYNGSTPFPAGGSAYSQTLSDYDVGEYWFVSVQAVDENGNRASISNSPVSKPWDEFQFSGNDFNFGNFSPTMSIPNADDVNKFILHSFVLPAASARQLMLSVTDDDSPAVTWVISLDMNSTHVTNAAIWWSNSDVNNPDYNSPQNIPLSGTIDFLSADNFRTQHRYNGLQTALSQPLTFRVVSAVNITDFNLSFDIDTSGDDAIPWP